MGWDLFWFFGIVAILAGVAAPFLPRAKAPDRNGENGHPDIRWLARAVAVAAVSLAVVSFVLGGIREVPTRAVGVPTAFGSVQPSLRQGLHWKLPWTRVYILDETVQTTSFEGSHCLSVRIGGQQQACLDVTLQWRVEDAGASELYNDYNGNGSFSSGSSVSPSTIVPGGVMGNITDAVVIRELEQTVNQVLGDYNPITDVVSSSTAGNSQFSRFDPVVLHDMQRDLAGRIQVLNAFMPLLRYDSSTQKRLDQIQQQNAATAIAKAQLATNQAQSAANAAIANSVSNPNVLVEQCLQLIQTAEKDGFSGLPPTLSCFGGSGSIVSVGKG